jgi:hypothetical protein
LFPGAEVLLRAWPFLSFHAIQFTIIANLAIANVLLEKVRNASLSALSVDVPHPINVHPPLATASGLFAAGDDAMDAEQVRPQVDAFEERLRRDEADVDGGSKLRRGAAETCSGRYRTTERDLAWSGSCFGRQLFATAG